MSFREHRCARIFGIPHCCTVEEDGSTHDAALALTRARAHARSTSRFRARYCAVADIDPMVPRVLAAAVSARGD